MHGGGTARRYVQDWFDSFDDFRSEPEELIDEAENRARQRFRSKAGIAVEQAITQVLQFREGKVIYATGYRDTSNALKAVGLEE